MPNALGRTFSKCLLVVACVLLMQGYGFAADVNRGKSIAERWCASCHVVGHEQKSSSNDQAPPFASLAARADFNADRLSFLLLKLHPNMPELTLSRSDITDLADYILTLK